MTVKLAMILAVSASLAAPAQAGPLDSVHLTYNVYAAGLHVAEVDTRFATGPRTYQMDLEYHTTGLTGFFYRGHQVNAVSGLWRDTRAVPASFDGTGVWRGEERVARIEYDDGRPIVRALTPPNEAEREPVPAALQAHSIDSLSALMELIRTVAQTGRCELTVLTYDGRRATEIEARSAGDEILPYSPRSTFQGQAQRCDFAGKMLAGFKFGDKPSDFRPLHGSAWLAHLTPNGPLIPVRMTFETRWFGDATMFLTSAATDDRDSVARN
jgi:hypothetical protein